MFIFLKIGVKKFFYNSLLLIYTKKTTTVAIYLERVPLEYVDFLLYAFSLYTSNIAGKDQEERER